MEIKAKNVQFKVTKRRVLFHCFNRCFCYYVFICIDFVVKCDNNFNELNVVENMKGNV